MNFICGLCGLLMGINPFFAEEFYDTGVILSRARRGHADIAHGLESLRKAPCGEEGIQPVRNGEKSRIKGFFLHGVPDVKGVPQPGPAPV